VNSGVCDVVLVEQNVHPCWLQHTGECAVAVINMDVVLWKGGGGGGTTLFVIIWRRNFSLMINSF
jgi:hypothetical protein